MSRANEPYVIVVAVDYSESGDLALERALELGLEKQPANVHVINVLPVARTGSAQDASATTWAGSLPSITEAAEELRSYLELRIAAFRSKHAGEDLTFLGALRAHQRVDIPSQEIAQLAADVEADIVVVGTHSRRGIARVMLGSVAEATVRLAPCPVLVVRPKALPAPVPAIQPPCPRCVEARKASGGQQFWCEQHSERHGQRHTYHQGDRVSGDGGMPLVLHG
jgi:nucleotide-binding universal stress UspA family protein